MGQNSKKLGKNSHPIVHFPINSGVSVASERANGGLSGPVLTSGFLIILAHSAVAQSGL